MLTVLLVFSSCTSYKKTIYLENLAKESRDTTVMRERIQYHLQRGDILYIRIITNNEEIDNLFNLNQGLNMFGNQNLMQQQRTNGGMGGMLYFQGYSVDDSGYVDLPIVHKVNVLDKTIDEAKYSISNKLRDYLEDAVIIVKLDNFKVTFLGEVLTPGVTTLNTNKLNIMEALGHAGGIRRNGNRKDVLVIRRLDDGSQVYRLDLTDKNTIEQQNFELLPNDIVYVPPMRTSWFKDETTTFTFWLTTISTTMTTTALIISLLNN